MKKLVTLSAVALAGATFGVGSTFGWWAAEDVESQPAQVAQKTPADLKIESVTPVEATFESEGTQIDIIGDLQVGRPQIRTVHKRDPLALSLEERAEGLNREATSLEDKGEKAAASEKRELAVRLRVMAKDLKDRPIQVEVWEHRSGQRPGRLAPQVMIEKELHRLHEELGKTEDPVQKEKLQTAIRDLKTKLQQVQTHGPRLTVQHIEFPGHPVTPPGPRVIAFGQGPGGVPPFAIEELRKVAENLQREGHKDQAQAVREHADRLQRQAQEMQARMKQGAQQALREFARGPGDGPREDDGRDGDRPRPETRNEGPGRPDGRGPGFHDGDRHEHHPGGFHGPDGHHPPMPMGPHHGEVLGLLQALHHEIGQLRGEVHQLRKMLGEGHHPQKDKLKHHEHLEGKAQKVLEHEENAKAKLKSKLQYEEADLKAKQRDLEAKGKAKQRDDEAKGKAKHRDEDAKGKAKQGDDDDKGKGKAKQEDDDDDKGKAKNRDDDDDDDRKDKKKSRDDDDGDKDEDKKGKDDDDVQLDDAPAKPDDDAKGVEDKADQED